MFLGRYSVKGTNNFLVSFAFHLVFIHKNVIFSPLMLLLPGFCVSRTSHERTIMPSLINICYFTVIKWNRFLISIYYYRYYYREVNVNFNKMRVTNVIHGPMCPTNIQFHYPIRSSQQQESYHISNSTHFLIWKIYSNGHNDFKYIPCGRNAKN